MTCPSCEFEWSYEEEGFNICSSCLFKWKDKPLDQVEVEKVYRDTHGTVLNDGDSITVIKDLKVKGSSDIIKQGTRVNNIKLVDSDHDIDCHIPGIGKMSLKTGFVKKL